MRQLVLLVSVRLSMIVILPTMAFETGQFKWQKTPISYLFLKRKLERINTHCYSM